MDKLSLITITKNEQDNIVDCLKSVAWADEMIVIDNQSTDKTVQIAKDLGAKVFTYKSQNFSQLRNFGLKKATYDWILYLDVDERITPQLKQEIRAQLKNPQAQNFILKRQNYFLGTKMYLDQVERLFQRHSLISWRGEIHESPIYKGKIKCLTSPLLHFSHRNISSMLAKTNDWTSVEAKLLFQAHHPPVAAWRLLRIALTEFWNQFGQKKVFRYGAAGWIEGIFQIIDKIIIYVKLWELQHQ